MPKKIYALNPKEREKECDHPLGFSYSGKIPNTGRQVCFMCGTTKEYNDSLLRSITNALLP